MRHPPHDSPVPIADTHLAPTDERTPQWLARFRVSFKVDHRESRGETRSFGAGRKPLLVRVLLLGDVVLDDRERCPAARSREVGRGPEVAARVCPVGWSDVLLPQPP